jgi:hypothetical protein
MSERDIPKEIKRRVRERCGFGCVYCGIPIIDYHHIVPWAECQEHDPENIMLLCPTCHRKVGKWTRDDQLQVKARPKNILEGKIDGLLYTPGRKLKFEFGGGIAVNTPNLVMWQPTPNQPEQTIVGARQDEEGRVLMTLNFCNRDGEQLLKFVDNNFEIGVNVISDFQFRENYVEYKSKDGETNFILDFRSDVGKFMGRFHTPRGPLQVTEKHILNERNQNKLVGFTAIDCFNVYLLTGY